ncbi:type I-B CRISPR-associated protein Cas5b [Methanosalsum natronophilum]|uniref:type I-B CRISPR-associated protein Cas5b n=1 Tax=Methanosalsum natronophilum TaxID=768733 RepID=UPI0021671AFD|nr:type I-B CRISPR-associated protein Cas5b [Methanosalsum natronophilum]MCS3923886.1 CRISPR-associated protein Cas5h [Methanosalsum natronophilum]
MNVLVFDIWGEYGHFKKHYTTTSPLTYSIPPRTAIAGMMGAIIGLGKEEYSEIMSKDNCYIGAQILNPIKKTRISENLINTKSADMMARIKDRTQIRFEVLKDAKYRIYFSHISADIYQKAHEMLSSHKSFYSLSLGLSEHLANFEYVGEFICERGILGEKTDVLTVVPEKNIEKMFFFDMDGQKNKEYFSESMPVEMTNERVVLEYTNVLYEKNGYPITSIPKEHWNIECGGSIVFL